MTYYLILDKTNRVVCDFTKKEEAEKYILARPYLKMQEEVIKNTPAEDINQQYNW